MLKVAYKVAKTAVKKAPKMKKVAHLLIAVGEGCLIVAPAVQYMSQKRKSKKEREQNTTQYKEERDCE